MDKKALLIILDGWGVGNKDKADAIFNARTPYWDSLLENHPHSTLKTFGESVGLPEGQMGNSEVGHLNIGAGRIVYQDLVRVNKALEDGSLSKNETLLSACRYAREESKKVHLIGLVSNGGVHSSMKHLFGLIDIAGAEGLKDVFVHALTDGRDCDPYSGKGFIEELEEHLSKGTGRIASVCGRYYTMDRDKRWERVKKGYDLMTAGRGNKFSSAAEAMQASYDNKITDEFVEPSVITDSDGNPTALIEEGDVVVCFNFRTDRLREITTVLTQKNMPEHGMKTMPLHYLTLTEYDAAFTGVEPIFPKLIVNMTLGEYISKSGGKQLRIAETEKYAHVTFFFSGGRETEFENEERVLINSPKVATYDLQPEMSAFKVTDALEKELAEKKHDFICLNYANGDMVGHTGVYEAIIKACEAVDTCLSRTVETAWKNGYEVLIIADHGNADNAVNPDGSPNTAHSVGSVPAVYVGTRFEKIREGILADVAPTICKIMNLDVPEEMTGKVLLS